MIARPFLAASNKYGDRREYIGRKHQQDRDVGQCSECLPDIWRQSQEYDPGHDNGNDNQTTNRYATGVGAGEKGGEQSIASRGKRSFGIDESSAAQATKSFHYGANGDERSADRTESPDSGICEGCGRMPKLVIGDHAHYCRRAQNVDDGCDGHAKKRCERHILFGVFDHPGSNRSTFDPHESPEHNGYRRGNGGQGRCGRRIPAGLKELRIEEPPPNEADKCYGTNAEQGGCGLEPRHNSGAQHIEGGGEPDQGDGGGRRQIGVPQSRDEHCQIAGDGRGDGDVGHDVGEPVKQVALEPREITEGLACIGIGAAGDWSSLAETGEQITDDERSGGCYEPTERGDATDTRHRCWHHEYPGPDHIAGDKHCCLEEANSLCLDFHRGGTFSKSQSGMA